MTKKNVKIISSVFSAVFVLILYRAFSESTSEKKKKEFRQKTDKKTESDKKQKRFYSDIVIKFGDLDTLINDRRFSMAKNLLEKLRGKIINEHRNNVLDKSMFQSLRSISNRAESKILMKKAESAKNQNNFNKAVELAEKAERISSSDKKNIIRFIKLCRKEEEILLNRTKLIEKRKELSRRKSNYSSEKESFYSSYFFGTEYYCPIEWSAPKIIVNDKGMFIFKGATPKRWGRFPCGSGIIIKK